MPSIQELLDKAVENYTSGEEEEDVQPQVQPQEPVLSPEQTKEQGSLIKEIIDNAVKDFDPAENASNKVVTNQNNVVDKSEEPLVVAPEDNPIYSEYYSKRQLPANDTYNGIEVKPFVQTVEKQTEENFSRTKTTLKDLGEQKTQLKTDIKELGIIDEILKEKELPVDFMDRSQKELSKLRADELLEYIDQKNAIEFESERRYYNEYIGPAIGEELKDSPMLSNYLNLTGFKGYNVLMGLANGVQLTADAYTDTVQEALEIAERKGIGFETIKTILSFGGRFDVGDTPEEIAENIADKTGAALEFTETLPFIGAVKVKPKIIKEYEKSIKLSKELEIARRNNYEGAMLATLQSKEEARTVAKEVADKNKDVKDKLIIEYEINTKARDKNGTIIDEDKLISVQNEDGSLEVDYDLARKASEKTRRDLFDVEVDDDGKEVVVADQMAMLIGAEEGMLSPFVNPDKINSLVAVVTEFKTKYPNSAAFKDPNKGVIETLVDITLQKELVGTEELITTLNKYGMSFEEYVQASIGSFSDAGKVLNMASQIKRVRPLGEVDDIQARKLQEVQSQISQAGTRLENVRRGAMVSQIATAMRNFESAAMRVPMDSVGNMIDTVMYEFGKPIRGGVLDGTGGFVGAAKALINKDLWKDAFSSHKYVFSRPDVAKGFSDLILSNPQFQTQAKRMFDNLNEIRKATGRGEGGLSDKILSPLEDVVEMMNTVNQWQEHLVRRGVFFGELRRLVKKEYNIDLIDTMLDGKLPDLLNDASTVRPDNARSFVALAHDAIESALSVTYAKQPDNKFFQDLTKMITGRKVFGIPLTTAIEFPRFMFNSMEIMAQYAVGGVIPVSKKVIDIVNPTKKQLNKMSPKDKLRTQRNLVGLAVIGAAYQYRTSENAPEDYKMFGAGENAVDTSPVFPMRQFLYIGEAMKHLKDGTFTSLFWDSKEFAETFIGTTFRTGTGNMIIEEIASLADGMDISGKQAAAEALGKAVGNYFTSYLTGFGQLIDAQRTFGPTDVEIGGQELTFGRENTYKKELKPAPKDAVDAAKRGLMDSYNRRFRDAEKEREMDEKVTVFAEDVERPDAAWKVTLGINLSPRDSDTGEYFIAHGTPKWKVGSNSDIDAVAARENEEIAKFVPMLHDAMLGLEDKVFRIRYKNLRPEVKQKYSEDTYVKLQIKPILERKLSEFKSGLKEKGTEAIADPFSRALSEYNRIPKDYRRIAVIEYMNDPKNKDADDPDLTNPKVLNDLIKRSKTIQKTYTSSKSGLMSR